MDHLNNRIGYLVMKEDGAVLESGGDLENDERSANIIMELLHLTDSIDDNFMPANSCERINLVYEEHTYSICMSNRRVYVIKLRSNLHAALSSSTAIMNGGGGSNLYLDSDNNSSSIALA